MTLSSLSPAELAALTTNEAVIERSRQTFVDVGNALLAIRDGRLYRENHATFDDYCRERWGMARSRAYQLIDSATVASALSTTVDSPTNEAQARELAPLRAEPEVMREVWQEAVDRSSGQPTAQIIREVREEVKFTKIDPPKNVGVDKTRAGIEARRERIRQMAREGYRAEAIAAAVGVGEGVVNEVTREAGIQTVHDRLGKSRRVDVNRVMEGVVDSAIPSEHAISALNADWPDLDRERFPEWRASLRQSINALRRIAERIEKELP